MSKVVIIGGGISGLATAHAIQKEAAAKGLAVELVVVERDAELGGTVKSRWIDGFLCETGPPGYMDGKPETPALVRAVGLGDMLLPSNDAARKRYLFVNGRLHRLPESPPAFLQSKLLSVGGKLRLVAELWSKKAPEGVDETIAEFSRRHIGREATAKLIDAVTTGIHAGDPEQLSLRSCFPVMKALEEEGDGSLIRAMIRRMKKARQAAKAGKPVAKRSGGEMGGGKLTTFTGGMGTMIKRLADVVGAEYVVGRGVSGLARDGDGYAVRVEGASEPIVADAVVLAVPAYAAAGILADFDPEASLALGAIPYAAVNVVNLGYKRAAVGNPLDGFGFLIPGLERRQILGVIWTSSVFDAMAPDDRVSLRVMVGGARNPGATTLDDERMLGMVQEELRATMDISADPSFHHIIRHERAIPQYTVGHAERVAAVDRGQQAHPGVFISGNSLRGVGFNDCTRNALAVGERVVAFLEQTAGSRTVLS